MEEFIHNLNSLNLLRLNISHVDESTLFDLLKIIQEMTLEDVLEVVIIYDNSEMVEFRYNSEKNETKKEGMISMRKKQSVVLR